MNHYGLVHVPNNIYLWRIETLEKLIDIYGDSIKMVSPDLFDFKRIEWLDVDEMLKYVELEYNKLSENCAVLMGQISDSFRASLQNSLQAYKQCRTATSRWAWRWQVWRCRMLCTGMRQSGLWRRSAENCCSSWRFWTWRCWNIFVTLWQCWSSDER